MCAFYHDLLFAGNRFVVQMDLKVAGLPLAVVCEALDLSTAARLEVLEKMRQCIAQPRPYSARYHSHPISQLVTVPPHLRTKFIGAFVKIMFYCLLVQYIIYSCSSTCTLYDYSTICNEILILDHAIYAE